MKYCAFTIVAKNYIGLAQILGISLQRLNPAIDFKIFVADEFLECQQDIPANIIMAKSIAPYSEQEWNDMAFRFMNQAGIKLTSEVLL